MGMKLFSDGKTSAPNPNPVNFAIEQSTQYGDCISVLEVNYPECTAFKGKKILVFNSHLDTILLRNELDPHFKETDTLIARFPATKEGRKDADAFAKMKVEQFWKDKRCQRKHKSRNLR